MRHFPLKRSADKRSTPAHARTRREHIIQQAHSTAYSTRSTHAHTHTERAHCTRRTCSTHTHIIDTAHTHTRPAHTQTQAPRTPRITDEPGAHKARGHGIPVCLISVRFYCQPRTKKSARPCASGLTRVRHFNAREEPNWKCEKSSPSILSIGGRIASHCAPPQAWCDRADF